MRLAVLGEAIQEFSESVSYYEEKESGLGWRFRSEVVGAVEWIQNNPELLRLRPKGYRRLNLRAFPHFIAYVIRDDHAHRRPEFWLGRI